MRPDDHRWRSSISQAARSLSSAPRMRGPEQEWRDGRRTGRVLRGTNIAASTDTLSWWSLTPTGDLRTLFRVTKPTSPRRHGQPIASRSRSFAQRICGRRSGAWESTARDVSFSSTRANMTMDPVGAQPPRRCCSPAPRTVRVRAPSACGSNQAKQWNHGRSHRTCTRSGGAGHQPATKSSSRSTSGRQHAFRSSTTMAPTIDRSPNSLAANGGRCGPTRQSNHVSRRRRPPGDTRPRRPGATHARRRRHANRLGTSDCDLLERSAERKFSGASFARPSFAGLAGLDARNATRCYT